MSRWHVAGRVFIDFVESRRQSKDSPVILVAHNGKRFDVPMLIREYERCKSPFPHNWLFLDSYLFFKLLYKHENGK